MTTAFDDQFTDAPESVRQTYSTADILRRNVADLEIALRKQTERAEKAEEELKELREQVPLTFVHDPNGYAIGGTHTEIADALPVGTDLYARPIPVPAPDVPDGDDFNGSTPHLIQCMEALVQLDADGVLVPHGIGRDASKLLSAAANRLRQQAAPAVPDEWREVMAGLVAIAEKKGKKQGSPNHMHERPGIWDDDNGPILSGKPCGECAMYDKARALMQSARQSGSEPVAHHPV